VSADNLLLVPDEQDAHSAEHVPSDIDPFRELQALGVVLMAADSPEARHVVAEIKARPDLIASTMGRYVWQAIESLHDQGRLIDTRSVARELQRVAPTVANWPDVVLRAEGDAVPSKASHWLRDLDLLRRTRRAHAVGQAALRLDLGNPAHRLRAEQCGRELLALAGES
jgi:hypothetical protein